MSLAHYIDNSNTTKGKVMFVVEYFVKIEFYKGGNDVEGQLRLADTKRKKLTIGESVTVSVKYYNKKRNCWELSLVE